jgi:hypothetical protein
MTREKSTPNLDLHGTKGEEMKDQEEIQSAWEICNLLEKLNDLLWNRYGNDFIEIYLREEDDKFLRTIGHPGPTRAQDKTEE